MGITLQQYLILSLVQSMLFIGIYVTIIAIAQFFSFIHQKIHMYFYTKKLYEDTTHLKRLCEKEEEKGDKK